MQPLWRAPANCLLLIMLVVAPQLDSAGRSISTSAAEPTPDFESQIAPILIKRCVECHQPSNASGGLQLTAWATAINGGDSGPAVDASSPKHSLLLQRVRDGEMPPEEKGLSRKLPPSEIDLLERWLAAGAAWPESRTLDWFERTSELRAGRDWWSLQPIHQPKVPQLSTFAQPNHPIDAFIYAELERNGLSPAAPADRRTLIRRLYYDLLGLPPTPAQIKAFVEDASPDAWERTVERLLESPQYGERWARYWLDLARYADSSGYERDQEKPFAWKYRDWVVRAFNQDMPYGKFITDQLAGDEGEHPAEQQVIATGFLRLGTWNDEPNDQADYQYERLEDLVHTTASAFLALTVKCARCHAHKFDPITQEDYYRMAAAFWPGPIAARDAKLVGGPTAQEIGFEQVLAWTDLTSTPADLHLLKNGDRHQPEQAVPPASLSFLPALYRPFDPPPAGARTSHRRRQLAEWISSPENPVTWRVAANRIWQHHFGEAIVRTPDNFGFLADPPTHPLLLDWLASELLSTGSFKHLHKLILTSQTWQQSSLHPDQAINNQRDATNRLWWHANRQRLDAEALRDSMLAVTGELDLRLGGESFRPTIAPEALEGLSKKSAAYAASPAESQRRRSLYGYLQRSLLPPLMTAFDLCEATGPCGQRSVTLVPTQALALLNNQFVHDRSQHLAEVILRDTTHPTAQVQRVWSAILQRPASESELKASLQYLEFQRTAFMSSGLASTGGESKAAHLALASLCHVLLNCNEFIYID